MNRVEQQLNALRARLFCESSEVSYKKRPKHFQNSKPIQFFSVVTHAILVEFLWKFWSFSSVLDLARFQTPYKKRLIFPSLNHQSDQQFEQKYGNKREKSRGKVENSLEFMFSQCCESSLTHVAYFCAERYEFSSNKEVDIIKK